MGKIAFILGSYFEENRGGAEMQAYELAKLAIEGQFEVVYIYITRQAKSLSDCGIILKGVRGHTLWTRLKGTKVPYIASFLSRLLLSKPDVIYLRCASALAAAAAIYAKVKGKRFIVHIASDIEVIRLRGCRKGLGYLDWKLMKYGVRKCTELVVQTNWQKEQLLETVAKPIRVIPNFHKIPELILQKSEVLRVLWIGNWKESKRPELFINLVKELKTSVPVEFVMIGDVQNRKTLEIEAKKRNIHVLGSISHQEVNEHLMSSHILISTSKYEGFSNVFIQAWMREIPIISIDVDPDDIIVNNHLGYVTGTETELIRATKELIENPALRNRMGKAAREFAATKLSMKNAEKLLRVIRGID